MKRIPLTHGKYAIVDDISYALVSQYNWTTMNAHKTCYARCHISRPTDSSILMHRLILGLEVGDKRHVDHINHDGLNNQRMNLRICSRTQNMRNRKSTGVYHDRNAWKASIGIDGRTVYLGRFKKKSDALEARRAAEQKFFKGFAYGARGSHRFAKDNREQEKENRSQR